MVSLDRLHLAAPALEWRSRLVAATTLVGWLLLAGLIASHYVGHSPGPYGMCRTPRGASVACALVRH